MGALDDYIASLNAEDEKDKVESNNLLNQTELGIQQGLNDIDAKVASRAYDPPLQYLATMASGNRIFALEDYVKQQADREAAQVRRSGFSAQQQIRGELAQRISDRRAKVNSALAFQQRNYADLGSEAPELENLRSDFLLDPKTMSVKQVKRTLTPDQVDDIRDAEIADYFGIPQNLVREKRLGEAQALDDASYERGQRANARAGWHDAALKRAEEERVMGAKRLNDLQDRAEGMDPVVWQYVNSPAGKEAFKDDPYTLQAAKLAEAMDAYKNGPAQQIKDQRELSKFFQQQLIAAETAELAPDELREHFNNPTKFKPEEIKAMGDKLAARMLGASLNEEAHNQQQVADIYSGIQSTESALTTRAPAVRGELAPTGTWKQLRNGAVIGAAPVAQESSPLSNAKSAQKNTPSFDDVTGGGSSRNRRSGLAQSVEDVVSTMPRGEDQSALIDLLSGGPMEADGVGGVARWLSDQQEGARQEAISARDAELLATVAAMNRGEEGPELVELLMRGGGEDLPRERQYETKKPYRMEAGEDPVSPKEQRERKMKKSTWQSIKEQRQHIARRNFKYGLEALREMLGL